MELSTHPSTESQLTWYTSGMFLDPSFPEAKIRPPRAARLVSRPRLLDPLEAAARAGQLILLVAPGGSGKTTLAADWAARSALPVAWYALDRHDRDTRRLGAGIIAALGRLLPAQSAQAARIIGAGGSEIAALGRLLGDLEGTPAVLILDDFHHLDDLPEAVVLWDHLLRYRPPSLCLAIVSRTVPVLGFAVLAATGALLGMGREDLGFDAGEAANLLVAHGLGPDGAAEYADRGGGWAMGLLLLAHAGPEGTPFLQQRSDLLLEQLGAYLLDPLPAPLRRFVLESACLGPVTAAEADAILGRADSAAHFRQILARDLFLRRDAGVFRYHDLFSDYCGILLAQEDPARWRALRRAAVDWWLDRRDVPRGLALLAALEDWSRLVAALDEYRQALWEQRAWGAILGLVGQLPPGHRTAGSLALAGFARMERGDYLGALALAEEGQRLATCEADWLSPALMRAESLLLGGRYREAVAAAEAGLAAARRVAHPHAVPRFLAARGSAQLDLGHLAAGRADLLAALAAFRTLGDEAREGHVLFTVASKLLDAGQAREAEGFLVQAGRLWRRGDPRVTSAYLESTWSAFHLSQGDHEAARARAERALDLARACGDPAAECAALVAWADALVAAGQPVEADRRAAEAVDLCARLAVAPLLSAALQARIRAALARRDRADSRNLVEAARSHASTPVDRALLDLLDGQAAQRAGAYGPAAGLLERAADQLSAANRPHHAARACLVLAEVRLAAGAPGQAVTALHRMTELMEPLGCEPFLWPTARMCRRVLGEGRILRRLRQESRRVLDRLAAAAAVDSRPSLRLSPFGQGRITLHDRALSSGALPPKAREALFRAGLDGGTIARSALLTDVWDAAPSGPRDLWNASRHLHRVLGDQGWQARGGLYAIGLPLIDEGTLFTAAADQARGAGPIPDRVAAGEQALDLFGAGGYLEWCETDWVAEQRARTRRLAVATCVALAGLYEQAGRLDEARAVCERAISLEPLEEGPRRALIRVLAGQGRMAGARQVYRDYQALIHEELGAQPSADLRRLVAGSPRGA